MDQAFVSNLEGYLYMNMNNLTEHQCKGKCPEFKEEQCNHCLVPDSNYSVFPNSSDYAVGDLVVLSNHDAYEHYHGIYEVKDVDGDHVVIPLFGLVSILKSCVRYPTSAEIKAKKRLSPPIALLVSGLNDVEKYHQRAIAAQGEVS